MSASRSACEPGRGRKVADTYFPLFPTGESVSDNLPFSITLSIARNAAPSPFLREMLLSMMCKKSMPNDLQDYKQRRQTPGRPLMQISEPFRPKIYQTTDTGKQRRPTKDMAKTHRCFFGSRSPFTCPYRLFSFSFFFENPFLASLYLLVVIPSSMIHQGVLVFVCCLAVVKGI